MNNFKVSPNEASEKEFYADAYQKESLVWVDGYGHDAEKGKYLIFSKTIFYPNGGGQKGDRGVLVLSPDVSEQIGTPGELPIVDTRKSEDVIQHFIGIDIENDVLDDYIIGAEEFKISIDWDYRFTQMRLHSAAHFLHCFVEKILGKSVDFPSYSELFDDRGVNRYSLPHVLNKEQLEEAVTALNDWTAHGHIIKTYPSDNPKDPEWFRWWECAEYKIPCGGLHPMNTNELGNISATMKAKKDATSITFRLGA